MDRDCFREYYDKVKTGQNTDDIILNPDDTKKILIDLIKVLNPDDNKKLLIDLIKGNFKFENKLDQEIWKSPILENEERLERERADLDYRQEKLKKEKVERAEKEKIEPEAKRDLIPTNEVKNFLISYFLENFFFLFYQIFFLFN
jgi:hypothetical protein